MLGCERTGKGIAVRYELGDLVGGELHDLIGGMSALILEMERFKREPYDYASVLSSVTYFQDSLRATLGELREVVSRLQGGPPTGLNGGLVEAIRTGPLAELHRQTGAATKITASPRFPRKLSTFTQIQLYRIAEQALRNVAQHRGASNVAVSFRVVGGFFLVQIADDGFGRNSAGRNSGQDIFGMQQRAQLIGGDVEMDDRVGGGTVVRVRVPVRD